jgi:hypothetical protein
MLEPVRGGSADGPATPRVSVVMAVCDGERFVAEAIESLRSQTLGDFEVIVVDDGSADSTPRIVDALAAEDDRILLHRRPHAGYPAALNAGWQAARGEYVGILDADDLAEPARLERQLHYLERHPEVGVVGGALLLVTTDGRPFYIAAYPVSPAEARQALRNRSPLGHTAALVRRSVLEEVGGYRSTFPLAEDYDLWLRISERYAVANLPDIVGRYRIHGGNGSIVGIRQQALSMAAARAEAGSETAGAQPDDVEIAQAELELALWWAQIAARAGQGWRQVEKGAWRLAGAASRRTSDPPKSQARIAQTRTKLDTQRGRRRRALVRRLVHDLKPQKEGSRS